MKTNRTAPQRHGASMIELLIVVGILVALIAIVGSVITGTGGQTGTMGAKDRAERQIAQLNLYTVYQGFRAFAAANDGKYPSTRTHKGQMNSDTTHQVFALLIEDGSLDPRQLISQNEMEMDFSVGSSSRFGPSNTSFALCDYDADNWLRYRQWNDSSGSQFALMSDRWYVDRVVAEYHSINGEWWHVLMGDGSTKIVHDPHRPGTQDRLFERDSAFGDLDALMVHD